MFSGLWYLSLSGQTVSSLVLSIGRLQPLHGQVICILAFAGHVLCPDYWALPYWGEAATGDVGERARLCPGEKLPRLGLQAVACPPCSSQNFRVFAFSLIIFFENFRILSFQDFIYLWREKGRKGERGGEKH